MNKITRALSAAAIAGGLAFSGAAPASAVNHGDALYAGQTMVRGDKMKNGTYELRLQSDGNLVLYKGSRACAASRTTNSPAGTRFTVQRDGNGVVYGGNVGRWATQTTGGDWPGAYASLRASGEFVMRHPRNDNYKKIWNCNGV